MPEDHERPDRTESGRDRRADEPTERIQFLSGDLSGSGAPNRDVVGEGTAEADATRRSDDPGSAEVDESRRDTRPGITPPHTAGAALDAAESPDTGRTGADGTDAADGSDRPEAPAEDDTESTDTIPRIAEGTTVVPFEGDAERTDTIPAVADTTETVEPAAPAAFVTAAPEYSSDATAWFGHHQPQQEPFGVGQRFGTPGYPQQPPFEAPAEAPAQGKDAAGSLLGRKLPPRRSLLRAGLAAGITLGVLVLLYIGDLAFSSGQVPRGTTVAGVDVGGLNPAAAERELRSQLDDSLSDPIRLEVGKASSSIDPAAAGLSMDWDATLDKAGSQPLNPITRLTSFFTTREVTPESNVDREKLREQLKRVRNDLHREPVEGTIRFEGSEPVPVFPVTGRNVDIERSLDVVVRDWVGGDPVALPYTKEEVRTTESGVRRALERVARPAVSGPVTVNGDGVQATLAPADIAGALRFEPNDSGGLDWHIDVPAAKKVVKPQVESTLKEGKDASFVFEDGKPTVEPSETGRGIDWKKTFEPLREKLTQSGSDTIEAVYKDVPAELTTEEAKKLGIEEKVSTFTTGGFSEDSGVNIKRVAQEVDGALVKPGETFSLNGHTGIRQKEQGYIASGIIKDGRPDEAVGGGISQFATTLYNASYLAGMKDVEHREHSYYISRYPMGREATVFQKKDGTSLIDVKFKNVSDSGILIKTAWTPDSVKVTFWGTKQYEVKSKTSDKTDITEPEKKTIPAGEHCIESSGKKGFTVYNTRIRKNIETGEVTKNRRKVVYDPQPIIKCEKKDEQ
ncbi:Vancomycin resistance protein YoaR, contains peptidoglycan-binding and VanW domains [Actinopolyspora xinjiangensis]|uniref:Vancomycin resistance protein YoaR, contains peptidoglycan-binding and VanW domains n=1 Tax=Actinopolyspora xinjiangensis TaxID=405564 RepID=A0A1H0V919_9ACTN|nr:VanW family protein [Actinopolyspora xinjiangensis]SDP75032.1 Vancomycin resistance protein YoaR, contains peptidoglycan-binding and VanW domains [Actinopolyspora xinjiangensis]